MEKFEFKQLTPSQNKKIKTQNIDFLKDIDVNLEFKLGEIKYPLLDILDLKPGSLINLNKEVPEILISADGEEIGKGEVVILDDTIHIRIKEIKKK